MNLYHKRWILMAGFMAMILGLQCGNPQTNQRVKPVDLQDDPQIPITITLDLKGYDKKDGLIMKGTIRNRDKGPYEIGICPRKLMCNVSGSHLLVRQGDWGMGLLDACYGRGCPDSGIILPAGASYSFDIRIPTERLPRSCQFNPKDLTVQLCYELDEGQLVHSNTVQAVMK